jgi:hypothetical protein
MIKEHSKVIIACGVSIVCAVAITVAIMTGINKNSNSVVNIEDTMTGTVEVDDTEPLASNKTLYVEDFDADYESLVSDIENLKSGDIDTVTRYFGSSDAFTPESVADRVSMSELTFLESSTDETGENEIVIHVCTIDYNKMNEDYQNLDTTDEEGKKEITKNLINGDYDVCYNIVLTVENGEVQVSEAFKQAITGGWYTGTGVELTPVGCIAE